MKSEFIELTLGSHVVAHGYDKDNKEITENVTVERFSKKIVALSRIKSISETHILTDYVDGRWIYWEYEEDYEKIKKLLI